MDSLKQAPFSATLMSSLKTAHDFFYEDTVPNSILFGVTGHAFLTNVTKGLGPCAPYTWKMMTFDQLTKDFIGVSMFNGMEHIMHDSSDELKLEVSSKMKKMLDSGDLVLLTSLEYQIIYAYDDEYFYTTKPWEGDVFSVTPNIKVDTFEGMKSFMSVSRVSKTEKHPVEKGFKQSLDFALSLFIKPNTTPDSAEGIKAFDFWLEVANDENAVGHGNWWTSVVWAESREMASLYMNDLIEEYGNKEALEILADKYLTSSKLFYQVANKETPMNEKVSLIHQLKDNELETFKLLEKLL